MNFNVFIQQDLGSLTAGYSSYLNSLEIGTILLRK